MTQAGAFWLVVPGVALALASVAEGSPTWSGIVLVSAYLGFAGGTAASDALLTMTRDRAESGLKTSNQAEIRGMFTAQMILMFWIPQVLFILALTQVARHLEPGSAPRSLQSTDFLVLMESTSYYFCSIGGAWFKAWRWSRTLARS